MLFSTLTTAVAAFSLFSSVTAAPTWPKWGGQARGSPNLKNLAKLMPQNTLPPPTGLQLKFVGLGVGTQNYTCEVGNDAAVPGTTGALATLYDLGDRLNTDPGAKWKISTISGLALSLSAHPTMLASYLNVAGYSPILGKHYFTPSNVPTFSLFNVKEKPTPLLSVKKNGTMDAPPSSCPGTQNEGAVKWLQLIDNGSSQGGVTVVYRLETAGGNPPATCAGKPAHFEAPYAAQYWVYGPPS